jgi:hypothetical protein
VASLVGLGVLSLAGAGGWALEAAARSLSAGLTDGLEFGPDAAVQPQRTAAIHQPQSVHPGRREPAPRFGLGEDIDASWR